MEWFFKVIKQYTDFSGRARRQEYWMFALFCWLISFVLTCILLIGIASDSVTAMVISLGLYGLFGIFIFLPSLAVGVRRLHDIGKSGSMMLVAFIPLIGGIWLLILYCTDSEFGENQWGPNPKGIGNQSDISTIGNSEIN